DCGNAAGSSNGRLSTHPCRLGTPVATRAGRRCRKCPERTNAPLAGSASPPPARPCWRARSAASPPEPEPDGASGFFPRPRAGRGTRHRAAAQDRLADAARYWQRALEQREQWKDHQKMEVEIDRAEARGEDEPAFRGMRAAIAEQEAIR